MRLALRIAAVIAPITTLVRPVPASRRQAGADPLEKYAYLRAKGVPVELVVYPQAQRGFDFRVVNRTLADDLAKIDSMNRAVAFMSQYLDTDSPKMRTSRYASAPLPPTTPPTYDPKVVPRAAPKGTGGGD